jgi:hypothetical protein
LAFVRGSDFRVLLAYVTKPIPVHCVFSCALNFIISQCFNVAIVALWLRSGSPDPALARRGPQFECSPLFEVTLAVIVIGIHIGGLRPRKP